jgi:hypothetical protein
MSPVHEQRVCGIHLVRVCECPFNRRASRASTRALQVARQGGLNSSRDFGSNPLIRIPQRYRRGRHTRSAGWCVWLVGGDCAPGFVCEGGLLAVAACADVVVMQPFVMSGAEQDEVVELRPAATLDRDEVVRFELVRGAAAGVLAVG